MNVEKAQKRLGVETRYFSLQQIYCSKTNRFFVVFRITGFFFTNKFQVMPLCLLDRAAPRCQIGD
jgi:hypothetical protein